MNAPVFPTRWDFLAATVLFGVHPDTKQLLLGSENGVDPVWVCWTDQRLAEHQLLSGYVLNQAPVRQVLPAIPTGTSVRIDPGLPQGMAFEPEVLTQLQEQCVPFPAGVGVDLGVVSPMPPQVRRAFEDIVRDHSFLERLWLVRYRIEDGPAEGLAVYETGPSAEAQESAVAAVGVALDASLASTYLAQLKDVQVLALGDLPERVRSWVEKQPPLASGSGDMLGP